MDFHSMKRKQLQALCKKHNIPANLSNLEMANRISELLKGKEDPLIQRPIEGHDEHVSETESAGVIVNNKVKKVRFSPEHELIEFSRSPELKGRSRRNMAVSKSSSPSLVNVSSGDMNKEKLGRPGRAVRSRGLKSMEGKVNENRGKNPKKGKDVNTNASAIEILDDGKSKEGDVDSSGQVMLLRGKILDAVDDEKIIEKIVDNPGRVTRSRVQKLTQVSTLEENRGRKVRKTTGNVAMVIAENKENKAVGSSSFSNRWDAGEVELAINPGEREKSKGKSLENKIVEEQDVSEPQVIRRSKRNTHMVVDSEILYVDKRKNENGEGNDLRKKSKLMATNGSGVDGEGNGSDVNPGRGVSSKMGEPIKVEPRRSNRRKNVIEADELKAEIENGHPSRSSVQQLGTADESSKDEKKVPQPTEVTRKSRRKTLSVKLDSADETETKRVLRGSVPELGIAEDSKDEKKVLQPTGVTGRSRRKTLSVVVSADDKVHTQLAVEKLETETGNRLVLGGSVPQLEIAGEVSKDEKKVLQPTITSMSRSKTSCLKPVDEENDTNLAVENLEAEELKTGTCLVEKECSAVQQSTRRSRRIASQYKSPGEIGRDSDKVMKRKRDVMNTNNVPSSVADTIKETSSKKAVPAASSGKVADSGKRIYRLDDFKVLDASSNNDFEVEEHFVIKEGLGSTSYSGSSANTDAEGTHGKKPDASIADNVESSDMKLINGRELVGSDTNAAPSNTEFEDDQVSVINIRGVEKDHSPLDIDVHELLEQNITDMDKNGPEAHVLSEAEDLGCNSKKVLPEGSNVSGSEGFDEIRSSTDSFLSGDQTDINTVMEVRESKLDGCLQPSPNVVDCVGEAKRVSVEENLGSDEPRKDNQVHPECSKISEQEGLAETTSSADNPLPGDQIYIKTDVEVAEVEAEKCLQSDPCVVGELKVIAAQENLNSDETGQDGEVLPEVSNDSGKEGSAETGSSADIRLLGDRADIMSDPEVAQAEAVKCLQPSSNVVDHVGVDIGVSIQEKLDLDETGQDDQALPEVTNDSGKEDSAETGSFADSRLHGDQTDITNDAEVAQAEAVKCLQPSPNVVDHVGVDKGISIQEKLDLDESGQDDQALPEVTNDSGKEDSAETGSFADSRLLGDQTDITNDAEVAHAEAVKCLQPSPNVVDQVGVDKGVSIQENLDLDETEQDGQALPEVSNDSGKEGSAETGSFADNRLLVDAEVAQAEAVKCLQPSPNVVDHVGVDKGVSIQEKLDLDETGQDDQALPEVTNDSGKEDSAETGSFADSRLLGDQTDITNDAEVAQAEAVKCLQPSPNVVDHVGVDKGVSIQENLDLDETEQDGQALPEVSNDSGKEGSAETGSFADSRLLVDAEVAQAEAVKCLQPSPNVVDHVGVDKGVSIQENLDLDETEQDNQALPEVSNDSGKEGSAEIGSSADIRLLGDQTDITTDLEVAPSEADKCSQSSPNVVDHVGVVKGVSVQGNLDLDETRKENQGGSNVSGNEGFALTVSSDDGLLLDDQTDTKKVANVEGDYRFQPSPSEVDHEVEGMSVQENLDFDETKQAYICSPVSCHRTDVDCLEKSDNILDNINEDTPPNAGAVESCERPNDYNHSRSIMNLKSLSSCGLRRLEGDDMTEGNEAFFHKLSSELTETDEGGSLDIHKSASYRDSAFGIPDFSDGERSAKVAPQDNLKKDHEVHILENCTDKSSNSEDGKTVEGEFCHKNKCDEHGQFSVSNLFKAERRSGIMPQDKEAISDEYSLKDFDKSSKDEDWEFNISNLFDGERSARIKDSNKQVAIPDVPVVSTTCENYNEGICPSKLVGVSESQERPESPLADTTAVADIILLPETCCSSIETAGNATCLSKTNIVGSSAYDDADDGDCGKEKDDCSISEIGVEGPTEMKFQDAEETEEQSLSMLEQQSSPVTREEPNDVKNTQSWTEIELHNLFGTMFDTPGPNDASSSRTEAPHPTSMNKSISKNRDSLTKKEIEMEGERSEYETGNVSHAGLNVDSEENQFATPIKKDETWSHGSGLDRPVPSVIKCSDTMKENVATQSKSDEKDHHTGFELESVEMVNISTTVLPEASEEQLTEKTVECLKETTLKIEECEEEKAIPLRESCLYEAPGDDSNLTQRNCIGSSGSPRNLAQIDGCQDLLTDSVLSQSISCKSRIYHATEGDMIPCGEAVFGLSGADLQRSNLPEKSNHLIACSEDGNILRETPVESFRGPLDAEVADTSIFGGTSPCPFSKFMEFDEVTKRGDSVRKDNDLCGTNSRSSQDISDDIMEGDHDMIGKAVEESVTASMVQFSIPQLHFKEQAEDFNIPTHNISDVPPPECTEILKESDVADTIKEYIDSESSLSMVSENSSVSFPIDETTHTDENMAHENAALSENNEDAAERFMNTEDEVDYLETESKEPEDSTAMEPLIETKRFDIKLDSQKQIEADGGENSSFKQLCSTAKKNARTILIHGTPGKLPATADMKENAPMHKSSNVGDLTTVRPAKRKALRDVRWK
ncbi:hypothetical protein ACS0TY_013938 [Phlomoides rotata]